MKRTEAAADNRLAELTAKAKAMIARHRTMVARGKVVRTILPTLNQCYVFYIPTLHYLPAMVDASCFTCLHAIEENPFFLLFLFFFPGETVMGSI